MPFCVQCGQSVGGADKFCAKCGTPQKDPQSPVANFLDQISQRNMILFCYIPWVGWISSIVALGSPRFRGDSRVRFHAFQGLYLFVAWLLVEWVVSPMFGFAGPMRMPFYRIVPTLFHLVVFAGWIVMIIKASHDEDYHLPVIGDLAQRSASEQH